MLSLQALSPTVYDALEVFKDLQVKTENEIFWLLLAWVEAQREEREEGTQALFLKMVKQLSSLNWIRDISCW